MRLQAGPRVMRRFWPRVICCGVLYGAMCYLVAYLVVESELFSRWPL
jgi:hypothetical protein